MPKSTKKEIKKVTQAIIDKELSKPYKERKPLAIGRGGRRVRPRNYGHTEDRKAKLIEEALAIGDLVNPLSGRKGPYWGFVESLIGLGVDKWHTHATVKAKMVEVMSAFVNTKKQTIWEAFITKQSRPGSEKPKDVNGKIKQNARVLQRLNQVHSYGLKLSEFGMCIDIHVEPVEGHEKCSEEFIQKGTYHYRLNSKGGDPVKPLYSNPSAKRGRKPKKKVEEVTEDQDPLILEK